MRAIALGVLVTGCGSGAAIPASAPVAPQPSVSAAPSAAAAAPAPALAESLPSLDALAARQRDVAPGMREIARGEVIANGDGADRPILVTATADSCVRVVLAASAPVQAWLTDGAAHHLAEQHHARDVLLGPLGPVCVRKGDDVTLHVEAREPFAARFVSWASP